MTDEGWDGQERVQGMRWLFRGGVPELAFQGSNPGSAT